MMSGGCKRLMPVVTEPHFNVQADEIAMQMSQYSLQELQRLLKVNPKIAAETKLRYQNFFDDNNIKVPSAFLYSGMVFKKLALATFSDDDLVFANKHLLICSFLYGLLRPLDLIKKYRMEGNVALPSNVSLNMFDYWKPLLTDYLINLVVEDDGVLVDLASEEMKSLFDWNKVESAVRVVSPEFHTIVNGSEKSVVIYTKMCRGAMTRYILSNRISQLDELKLFEFEGYKLNPDKGDYYFRTCCIAMFGR
jgi:cytoplasmic iron level regulating protein YaaA (DUF328/UPF0246 family)